MAREISGGIRRLMRDLKEQGYASEIVLDDNVDGARKRLYQAAKHLDVKVTTSAAPDGGVVTAEVKDHVPGSGYDVLDEGGEEPIRERADVRDMARATLLREPGPAWVESGALPDRVPDTPSSPVTCLQCSASLLVIERNESTVRRHTDSGRMVVGDTRYLVVCESSEAHEYLDTRHKWRVDDWFRKNTRVKRLFVEDGAIWDA